MIDTAKIADAEMQAEVATLQRELAIAKNRLESLDRQCQAIEQDNDALNQQLLKRARRDGESNLLMDRLNSLRAQLRDAERSRDQAQTDAAELRAVMQQYVEQIQTLDNAIDPEEHEALRRELEMVRDQARRDVQELQDKLDEQASAPKSVDSDNVIEIEVLRQEHDAISHSLADRETELQQSQQTCQLLEDELEDAHTEIDEMRRQLEVQAEELETLKAEPEPVPESVEEILAENIAQEDEVEQSVPVLDIKQSQSGIFSPKSMPALITGIVVGVLLLEAVSFALGRGELISGLLEGSSEAVQTAPAAKPAQQPAPTVAPPVVDRAAGQISRD